MLAMLRFRKRPSWSKTLNPYAIAIASLYLLVRLPFLGSDILNSDGARWYRRSTNFLTALLTHNYRDTYQHYQPGVTLMWLRAGIEYVTTRAQMWLHLPIWYPENYIYFGHIHTITKGSLVLILFALFGYQVLLVSKLYGAKVAGYFALLIAVEPYLAGIDRWFHLTSLEVYFAFSAILTLLYWTQTKPKYKYLALVGVLLALATLSKVTSSIALLPVIGVIVCEYGLNRKTTQLTSLGLGRQVATVLGCFIITFSLLFPALWTTPKHVSTNIYKAVRNASGILDAAPTTSFAYDFSYYPIILAFKLSPVTLVLVIGLCYQLVTRKLALSKTTLYILLYLMTYYVVLSSASKKIDRYSLVFFFPLVLYAAIFAASLSRKLQRVVLLGLVITCGYVGLNNYPVLSAYYSPLAGGEATALNRGYYDNSGEYFAQAAKYLNPATNIKIFVPNNFESFKYFSKNKLVYSAQDADYVVLSHDTLRPQITNTYCGVVEKVFGPRFERPVVFVYRCGKEQVHESIWRVVAKTLKLGS